jgi:hypothetical protein
MSGRTYRGFRIEPTESSAVWVKDQDGGSRLCDNYATACDWIDEEVRIRSATFVNDVQAALDKAHVRATLDKAHKTKPH